MSSEPVDKQWSGIRARAQRGVDEHNPNADSFLYNGGTIAVLASTGAAAFLYPADLGMSSWLPPALSGFAAFLVAMERALNFGPRWRYQLSMRAGYEYILDQIEFLALTETELSEEERRRYRREILEELRLMRRREGMVPGIGGAPEASAEGTRK